MQELKGRCGGCGRPATLPGGSAAGRRCMYCGGELTLDAASAAAAAKQAHPAADRPPRAVKNVPVVCPFCARRLLLRGVAAGDDKKCPYCSAPFAVTADGGEPLLAAPGRRLRGDAAEDPEAAGRLGLDGLAAADQAASERLKLAAEALCWRVARGHASEEEAGAAAAVLRAVAAAEPHSGDGWVCPLPPLWAGELIARVILGRRKADLSRKAEEFAFVRVETGVHFVRADGSPSAMSMDGIGEAVKDAVIEAAIDQGIQALTGGEFGYNGSRGGDAPEIAVKHFFRADIVPVPGGSRLTYSHEWATGERKDFEDVHREILREVALGLKRRVDSFAALKAVFGDWFGADAYLCLKEERLRSWLKSLSPRLLEHPGTASLCAGLKGP